MHAAAEGELKEALRGFKRLLKAMEEQEQELERWRAQQKRLEGMAER